MIDLLRSLVLLMLCLSLGTAGCTPPAEELNDDDLKLTMDPAELVGQTSAPQAGDQLVLAPKVVVKAASPAHSPKLQLDSATPYEGGHFGLIGHAKAFVAPISSIPDDHRLYWVMVKVLSEKYSCFMQAKYNSGQRLLVRCLDGRRVVMWRGRGADFVQFHARQYDEQGYEIIVRKHRIIRVKDVLQARSD